MCSKFPAKAGSAGFAGDRRGNKVNNP